MNPVTRILLKIFGRLTPGVTGRMFKNWALNPDDFNASIGLLRDRTFVSRGDRWKLIKQFYAIFFARPAIPHTQAELLTYVRRIFAVSPDTEGVIVEAGCFKGISSAKLSLAARLANRKLVIFDSFEGIPENTEDHDKTIFGGDATFGEGDYAGSLNEVQNNIREFGDIDVCEFNKGWFDDSMPGFERPVIYAVVDVDLVSSTRTCIEHMFPLLQPGCSLISQDAHLPLVVDLMENPAFWRDEIKIIPANIQRLSGTLMEMVAP